MPYAITVLSALWLGILASISPCPLGTNIVAISFISRRLSSPGRVLAAGLLYTVGRAFTYLLLGSLVVTALVSVPGVSQFLQGTMNKLLGPLLIVVGMMLAGLLEFAGSGSAVGERVQHRVEAWGLWGALLLGVLFAATFCPITASIFFASLVPLAVRAHSPVLVPAVFGVGTALPVVLFAVLIAVGAGAVGRAFERIKLFEWWARRGTGLLLILVGIYFCLRYIFGLWAG